MRQRLAVAVVFGSSAAVLVVEIAAGRLLAPYVGVSLETFTAIIGVILAGIATGAALGGRLADRREPAQVLGPSLVVGGALVWASVPIVRAIGPAVDAEPVDIVVLATAAFFLPAAALSASTPLVAKLRLRSLELTGLWNRRGFAVAGSHALAEADRHGLVSQLLFLDLDGLKAINDEHGHAAGDTAIRAVASAVERALREVDVACRFGGDEFVLLAVGTPAAAVDGVVDRVEAQLERAAPPVPVRFTVGVAERPPHGSADLDALIDAADRDMYQHKLLRRLRDRPS